MLGDNIKKYRRERGYTQEELSGELNVVRQTLSKWENNLSVPDAEMLIRISKSLDVPVSVLLDLTPEEEHMDLTDELARVNAELAERTQQLQRNARAGNKRGQIVFLSFLALVVMVGAHNPVVSLLVAGGCFGMALVILYRNLSLFSESTVSEVQIKLLKVVTVVNAAVFAVLLVVCGLMEAEVITLTEQQKEWLLIGVFCGLFLLFGAVSPRLPFQRHTGLRLPWTVRDEDTWNLAHRVIGVISLPLTVLYLALACLWSDFVDLGTLSVAALLLYIGIPGVLSLLYFWKKYH